MNLEPSRITSLKSERAKRWDDLKNHVIDRVTEALFLGVIIDENLTWIPHISNIARNISKSVGIMYKASFCLSTSSILTLYYSLVYPYLQYCICVWGSTYLNRLIKLQKRAVRNVAHKSFDAHTDPLFKSLKILKCNSIYIYHVAKMFQFKNNMLP